MAISRTKKDEIIGKLEGDLKNTGTIAFVNFHGLTVKDTTQLRKDLRNAGVAYYVAKKTLVKRVLDAQKYAGTQPDLKGELAIAWSEDPIAAAKGVYEFAKTHKEHVSLLGGVYQKAYMSKEEIMMLASIPSREALFSKFVGMLNESIAQVVRVIDMKAKQSETAPISA